VRLDVDSLSVSYGSSVVLRDISMCVPAGAVVALLGPNGAGKTTLLSAVSGLVPAREGRVLFDGCDRTHASVEARAASGLCHVTEAGAIFPSLTVAENLRMFVPANERARALETAISVFPRLGQRLAQPAGTMSGGEQRMLALARAYVTHPSLVLLDEISLGLAPVIVDEIFDSLRSFAASGTSMLIVEQYVQKVLDLADLVFLLVRGRVVFAGEPSELRRGELMSRYLGESAPSPSGVNG
jgi:branched-chain amino acid transport system ATP-binding protein